MLHAEGTVCSLFFSSLRPATPLTASSENLEAHRRFRQMHRAVGRSLFCVVSWTGTVRCGFTTDWPPSSRYDITVFALVLVHCCCVRYATAIRLRCESLGHSYEISLIPNAIARPARRSRKRPVRLTSARMSSLIGTS